MGVFDDQKFEKLDWVTQVTETIEGNVSDLLASLPDEHTFTVQEIKSCTRATWNHFEINKQKLLSLLMGTNSANPDEFALIKASFKLEVDAGTVVDFENQTMSGNIKLIKIKHNFEDEELQKIMGKRGIAHIRNLTGGASRGDSKTLGRTNEILELLGNCDEYIKSRSARSKLNAICARVESIFSTNEWRIRDMVLADKVGIWIAQYIESGNLAAFANFCKLKVMTHNCMPIYSVQEEL